MAERDPRDVARALSDTVLRRLGEPVADWHTLSVEAVEPVTTPPPGLSYPDVLLIRIGSETSEVGVHYTLGVPDARAIAATTEQIQDHAIEATHGTPLPPCPGHAHPLMVRVIDDVAVWTCPKDPALHREPVFSESAR